MAEYSDLVLYRSILSLAMLKTKLEESRRARGWSQQVLGFHASVSASDVSKFETGRMRPYPGQADRLAKILGLKPDELQSSAEQEAVRSKG